MEIQNEIVRTKNRIGLLENQNEKFKFLIDKAQEVSHTSPGNTRLCENDFLRHSLEVIEEEKELLTTELNNLLHEEPVTQHNLLAKYKLLEEQHRQQAEELDKIKREHAEIKFLLLHPEGKNTQWLKNILSIEQEASSSCLVTERIRLQRKILTLEKRRAELLLAINDVAIPEKISSFIKQDLDSSINIALENEALFREYEDLRFKMLNLEDERGRLLTELQSLLDKSKQEIADEYLDLQKKISAIEAEKDKLKLSLHDAAECKITKREVENILGAFRNIPRIKYDDDDVEEQLRIERIKRDVGGMFSPGMTIPISCTIL